MLKSNRTAGAPAWPDRVCLSRPAQIVTTCQSTVCSSLAPPHTQLVHSTRPQPVLSGLVPTSLDFRGTSKTAIFLGQTPQTPRA
ncbi:unnamed protein product [Protopolystoma xenopodis]|uniref:Uncharacterized protein n=1 Tax=Protopolystoma xenopodis TaxID=117903 RepID=A0A3S5C8M7_9PLAT|nr:unnamed protein product [Protopolystoma xenopodis]